MKLIDTDHKDHNTLQNQDSGAHTQVPEQLNVLLMQMVRVTGHVPAGTVRNVLRVAVSQGVPNVGTLACNTHMSRFTN
jgi:hypothetical protein